MEDFLGRESDVGFLIKLIYDAHGKVLYQRFRSEGITPAQAEVHRFVMAQGGARTTLRDVEAFLGVSHPTVVGLVSRLVEKGLLISVPDPEDKRARNLYPLPPADAKDEALNAIEDSEELLTRGLSPEERAELVRMLKVVRDNLQKELGE